jgi:hypothetical protein
MFYMIPNLISRSVTEIEEPWAFVPKVPAPHDLPKTDFEQWRNRADTDHCFFSGFEGLSAGVRIGDDNPPFKMHAVVGDYDAILPEDPVKYLLDSAPCGELPNYLGVTQQHRGRLVWVLEQPLLWPSKAHAKAFLRHLKNGLQLPKWLKGFEVEALSQPHKYYEVGRQWHPVKSEARIPKDLIQLWFIKSAHGLQFDDSRRMQYTVPLEEVAKEVQERWPGRWSGAFELGRRGVRFWDPQADNETAAVVTAEGMLCFTGDQPFVSWRQVFGKAFVEQYEKAHVSGIMDTAVFDGDKYWVLDDKKEWVFQKAELFRKNLKKRGFSAATPKDATISECEEIELMVQTERRVDQVLPLICRPTGVMSFGMSVILNNSRMKAMPPGAPYTKDDVRFSDGRRQFPFLYSLIHGLFVEKPEDVDDPEEQIMHFLAWLAYAYKGAVDLSLQPGQALVLAGKVGKGKTFLCREVIGRMFGGWTDATPHLLNDNKWTDHLAKHAIMCVDDCDVKADARTRQSFARKLKAYVANASMAYACKFGHEGELPWPGRILVTSNDDSASMQLLPSMDASNKGKMHLMRTAVDHNAKFSDHRPDNIAMVNRELPALCRFLYDWPIPEGLKHSRFGTKPFHHKALEHEVQQVNAGPTLEMIVGFYEQWSNTNPAAEYWEGTATQLFTDISQAYPEAMRQMNSQTFATKLGILKSQGYHIDQPPRTVTQPRRLWRLYPDSDSIVNPDEHME